MALRWMVERTQDEFGNDRYFVMNPEGDWVGEAHPTWEAAEAAMWAEVNKEVGHYRGRGERNA